MKKNNMITIIGKEFKRFFSDRSLVFTAILMPGLLIYAVYTLMGSSMQKKFEANPDSTTLVNIDNLPQSIYPSIQDLPILINTDAHNADAELEKIADKDNNVVYMVFPEQFDSLTAVYTPASGEAAPNVKIYYNGGCPEAEATYNMLYSALENYENQRANLFDINAASEDNEVYDMESFEDSLGDLLSGLIPMLIMMLLFSGCMAVAPTAIAGEKERGTLATLLVTPMKRSQLASGKIIALSCFALLSGISSFLGIMLSLPKMLAGEGMDSLDMASSLYTTSDYLSLLCVILSTTLIIVSAISIISAFAKDVKNAGTMVTPLMLVMMVVGLSPLLSDGTPMQIWPYLIPFFNSIQCMAGVFNHSTFAGAMVTTIVANVACTVAAVWALTKMFDSEKVMFRH